MHTVMYLIILERNSTSNFKEIILVIEMNIFKNPSSQMIHNNVQLGIETSHKF